jgi:transcriptional regulator with PAS, ATPase and Fis domain
MATWNCIQSEDGAAGAVLNEAPGSWQPVHPRNVVDISQSARERHAFQPIIGCSLALDRVLSDVRIVAPTSATVLIEGETGIT